MTATPRYKPEPDCSANIIAADGIHIVAPETAQLHDALVTALTDALPLLASLAVEESRTSKRMAGKTPFATPTTKRDAYEKARAALAKVKP